MVFGGVEIDEEIVDFIEDGSGAGVAAIDFIQDDDGRQLGLQRFLQNVARLRKRAFARVHEEKDAIDHAQGALDFAAKIAVAGRVHNVDFRVVIEERGVLRKDSDAAFLLEIVRVHDTVDDDLIGAENSALAQHGIDERGLAVIHVGDDGDVANGLHGVRFRASAGGQTKRAAGVPAALLHPIPRMTSATNSSYSIMRARRVLAGCAIRRSVSFRLSETYTPRANLARPAAWFALDDCPMRVFARRMPA